MTMEITSAKNPRLREVAELAQKASARKKRQAYPVEGIKMFREIPKEDLLEVWFSDRFASEHPETLSDLPSDLPSFRVCDPLFGKISDTTTPQGILAVVRQREHSLREMISEADHTPLLILLENLQDPGNLGTILRSSEGAGVTGVILSADSVDLYSPKVIRSTMGAIFRLPILVSSDLKQTVQELEEAGIALYAAHLDALSRPYDQVDWTLPSAFLIGNESKGLSEEMTKCAREKIHIPMQGQVESLNAAVAASLIAFEAARNRRTAANVTRCNN